MPELNEKEAEDVRRALHIAMKVVDRSNNKADKLLADRLERIFKKLSK